MRSNLFCFSVTLRCPLLLSPGILSSYRKVLQRPRDVTLQGAECGSPGENTALLCQPTTRELRVPRDLSTCTPPSAHTGQTVRGARGPQAAASACLPALRPHGTPGPCPCAPERPDSTLPIPEACSLSPFPPPPNQREPLTVLEHSSPPAWHRKHTFAWLFL